MKRKFGYNIVLGSLIMNDYHSYETLEMKSSEEILELISKDNSLINPEFLKFMYLQGKDDVLKVLFDKKIITQIDIYSMSHLERLLSKKIVDKGRLLSSIPYILDNLNFKNIDDYFECMEKGYIKKNIKKLGEYLIEVGVDYNKFELSFSSSIQEKKQYYTTLLRRCENKNALKCLKILHKEMEKYGETTPETDLMFIGQKIGHNDEYLKKDFDMYLDKFIETIESGPLGILQPDKEMLEKLMKGKKKATEFYKNDFDFYYSKCGLSVFASLVDYSSLSEEQVNFIKKEIEIVKASMKK